MMLDAIRSAAEKLESDIANGPIVPTVTPQEIRNYLTSHYDFTKPGRLDEIGADVERMLRTWQVQVTHPRYFGLFNPSVMLASVVADTLVAMYNPQLATWRTSPAANEIERHTLSWLAGKFGFPAAYRCEFHQWWRGSESFGDHGCFDPELSRLWRRWAAEPYRGANDVSDGRSPSLVQQDRTDDRTRAEGAANDRDRPQSEDGSRRSRKKSGRGPEERARALPGGRHCWDNGSRRD